MTLRPCRCNGGRCTSVQVDTVLRDGTPVHLEVRKSSDKELELNGIPPWIAIGALGKEVPLAKGGETVEDAVGSVIDRLNERYVA